jgi:hypothetical protein
MENDDTHGSSWAELCARHEATSSEVEAAMLVVKRKVDAGSSPSIQELVRLENAQAARNAIERQMRDLATTRRDWQG